MRKEERPAPPRPGNRWFLPKMRAPAEEPRQRAAPAIPHLPVRAIDAAPAGAELTRRQREIHKRESIPQFPPFCLRQSLGRKFGSVEVWPTPFGCETEGGGRGRRRSRRTADGIRAVPLRFPRSLLTQMRQRPTAGRATQGNHGFWRIRGTHAQGRAAKRANGPSECPTKTPIIIARVNLKSSTVFRQRRKVPPAGSPIGPTCLMRSSHRLAPTCGFLASYEPLWSLSLQTFPGTSGSPFSGTRHPSFLLY